MSDLSIPIAKAKTGVSISTNRATTIQIHLASIEILIGGPYSGHPYGHTALRVTTDDEDKIYDYGRYGRTWGIGDSEGEGILNVWSNFQEYINEENRHKRITTGFAYEISEEKSKEIDIFYTKKITGKKRIKESSVEKSFVIDKYYALGPNCTTLSLAGAKIAIPDIDKNWKKFQDGRGLSTAEKGIVSLRSWPEYIFMPADFQAMLENSDKKPKKTTIYKGNT